MPYEKRSFVLTLNGDDQPLTLKGIGTPSMVVSSESNNASPVYVGNLYDSGINGVMQPLSASNSIDTLLPGQGQQYNDRHQFDRFDRKRNPYIENSYRHIMSQWYVRGAIGDLVYVTWLDENLGPLRDINGAVIDVENLSR